MNKFRDFNRIRLILKWNNAELSDMDKMEFSEIWTI